MIFNSIEFAFFLPVVFALYWLLKKHLWWQNLLVLVASYVFYGWWNWKYLVLIIFTSGCSYASGLLIRDSSRPKIRKTALWGNILVNLGILGLFKYYNFFISEFAELMGLQSLTFLLNIVLPVGISFYTFQALSYSIDISRGKVEPTRDVVAFFSYIAFFPQLVAGPIERASNLLPQFLRKREFDYGTAVDGCRQILWGLFKKMVVADNCAPYVDAVFTSGGNGTEHLMAAILFAIQIYGDFSGYSDIAIGTAKLFGIRLMQNFRTPYFSRDIAEFWRRWHISLTSWFRDYLYIPLGGSRVVRWKVVRNTFIIFLVSGLWHGANWTFLLWGFYHACLFLPLILLGKNRKYTDEVASGRLLPTLKELVQMVLTFALVTIGWVIFRAPSIDQALLFFHNPTDNPDLLVPWVAVVFAGVMFVIEWTTRHRSHGLDLGAVRQPWIRAIIYYFLVTVTLLLSVPSENFIYFQF